MGLFGCILFYMNPRMKLPYFLKEYIEDHTFLYLYLSLSTTLAPDKQRLLQDRFNALFIQYPDYHFYLVHNNYLPLFNSYMLYTCDIYVQNLPDLSNVDLVQMHKDILPEYRAFFGVNFNPILVPYDPKLVEGLNTTDLMYAVQDTTYAEQLSLFPINTGVALLSYPTYDTNTAY